MAKKVKAILTLGLLKKKLSEWTLSAHVADTLNLSSEDDAQIKKELFDLCDKGLVEKEGNRRGLKFRLKPGVKVEEETEEEEVSSEETHIASTMLSYTKQKRHDKDTLETAGKEFNDLLKYVLLGCSPGSDPSIPSYTLAIKHTTDGVSLRIYSGILCLCERSFTIDKFLKYISQSGVKFNVDKPASKPSVTKPEPEQELAAVI